MAKSRGLFSLLTFKNRKKLLLFVTHSPRLPWNDTQLAQELKQIFTQVHNLNKNGYFTINSQPAVNCASSDHPDYGWGPKNGYVWQKVLI